jgi:hypothetical protein
MINKSKKGDRVRSEQAAPYLRLTMTPQIHEGMILGGEGGFEKGSQDGAGDEGEGQPHPVSPFGHQSGRLCSSLDRRHRRPPSAVVRSKSCRRSGRPCSSLDCRAVRGGAAAPSGEGPPAEYGRALPVILPGRAMEEESAPSLDAPAVVGRRGEGRRQR